MVGDSPRVRSWVGRGRGFLKRENSGGETQTGHPMGKNEWNGTGQDQGRKKGASECFKQGDHEMTLWGL
jgi:hypothetical protein